MKKSKKTNIIVSVIVLLMIISIGYAFVYTDLNIDGIVGINSNKWDIYWDNIQVTTGSKTPTTAATIDPDDKTKVNYSVYLENPGDFYEFTVDVVNNGGMNAMVETISSTVNNQATSTLPEYIKYEIAYSDGEVIQPGHLLPKKNGDTPTRETYTVRVEFRHDIEASDLTGISELNLNFTFEVTYIQADDTGELRTPMTYGCPGPDCLYRFSNQLIRVGSDVNTYGDASSSYEGLGDFFLGYITDQNGLITENYLCGKENGEIFCIRTGVNESDLIIKPIYAKNISILNSVYGGCHTNILNTRNDCRNSLSVGVTNNGGASIYENVQYPQIRCYNSTGYNYVICGTNDI